MTSNIMAVRAFPSLTTVADELLQPKLAQRVLVTLPARTAEVQAMDEPTARKYSITEFVWEKQGGSPYEGQVRCGASVAPNWVFQC
jgi:hypothetical protein